MAKRIHTQGKIDDAHIDNAFIDACSMGLFKMAMGCILVAIYFIVQT